MGRFRQSGAGRAPRVRSGIPAAARRAVPRRRRAAKRICRCNGPRTAASCATRRRAASSAPDRTRIPFARDDLYDDSHRKRIAPRLAHLPRPQTLALVRGLARIRRRRLARRRDLLHVRVAAARRRLALSVPAPRRAGQRAGSPRARCIRTARRWPTRSPRSRSTSPPAPSTCAFRPCPKSRRSWAASRSPSATGSRSAAPCSRAFAPCRPIAPKPLVVDLKVDVDESYMTAAGLAHNGGKRKGAVCTYLETWHLDIEEFLELRKNTGDDRRRTHDMNTANWIPDLFMKRVVEGGDWTLFSPSDVPDLHDKWGRAFEEAYAALRGQGRARRAEAVQAAFRRCSCGARCCRCCSRPGIRGSRSRTRATCARRSSTSAPCTARTCAPRSRSTRARPKSPSATWAR